VSAADVRFGRQGGRRSSAAPIDITDMPVCRGCGGRITTAAVGEYHSTCVPEVGEFQLALDLWS
jgi:hypothetical protein